MEDYIKRSNETIQRLLKNKIFEIFNSISGFIKLVELLKTKRF